jgi:hypothetical protein
VILSSPIIVYDYPTVAPESPSPPNEAPAENASIEIGTIRVGSGSRVRLRPYVALILDDDPFGAAGARYRRALFFHPDEIVPLDSETKAAP